MNDDIASCDFETKSGTDIKLGLARYFADPEAAVLTISYRLPGGEICRWNPRNKLMAPPQGLLDHVSLGGRLRGWNVLFEFLCWNTLCAEQFGWPKLKLEQLMDTMAQAAAQNLPQSLEKCGAALGLPADKLKSKRGKYLIQKLCKPRKPTKGNPERWLNDPELLEELDIYCDQDVVAEESIARKLRPLSEFQQQCWVLTQRINLRGIPVATDEVLSITGVLDAEKDRLNKELRALTGRVVMAATRRQQLLDWCNAQMRAAGTAPIEFIDSEDQDEERPGHEELLVDMKGKTVDDVLLRTDLPTGVRRALEIRRAVCQTSTAKFAKMLKILADDGTAKMLLVWHGAGTGRWASRGGLNAQNFARPLLKDKDIAAAFDLLGPGAVDAFLLLFGDQTMDALVSLLRGVLKAPEGYEFIDADYSSCENRVGVWLAGQDDKLDMFAKGFDEYKVFASQALYNIPYEAVTKDMRQMSKSAILGCLFGQGAKGLVEYAKGYGVELTLERAAEVVKIYRAEYSKVKALWYVCGDASILAVQNPGVWYDAGSKLKLICHRGFLWMKLPSGRLLAWSRPRVELQLAPWKKKTTIGIDADTGEPIVVEEDVWKDVVTVESIETKTRAWCRHKLIGSSIFQSGVQGTAADILACGVMNTEAAGYPTVLLAHDENMALVRKGFGSVEEFGALMVKQRDWYADLPLAFEGWAGPRFQK